MTGSAAPAPRRARAREWARTLVVAVGGWLLLRTFVVQAFHITSESMEHTLLVGDVLFVARPLYGAEVPLTRMRLPAMREPRHGDLVVFRSVETPGLEVVKRVIGLPGDTLAMRQGVVLRDGRPMAEPYVVRDRPDQADPPAARRQMRAWQEPRLVARPAGVYDPDRNNWGPVVVPRDSLFVMGDNRDHSYDGRYWGFLPRGNVDGEPLLVYYSYDPGSWRPLPLFTAVRWRRLFTVPH
ncbi:MAG TPA: signal peptidase I [Gemmatimonadales bacterium]|nr:signal peptidase I [Gemmatimonadales bacterium]